MSDITLGTIPPAGADIRDAVHVAVVSVFAGERLTPGQRVGRIAADYFGAAPANGAIGVVDPFRRHPVRGGERFWLMLDPGSVSGLRHNWSHPSFRDAEPPAAEEEEDEDDSGCRGC